MIVFIKKADDFLAGIEKVAVTILSGALVLILMTQVILRYGFSRPLFWAEEISVQLTGFYDPVRFEHPAQKTGQMIAIDMIIGAMPPKP